MDYYNSPWEPERPSGQRPAPDPWANGRDPSLPPTGVPPRRKNRGLIPLIVFVVLILSSIISLAALQGPDLLADPVERIFRAFGEFSFRDPDFGGRGGSYFQDPFQWNSSGSDRSETTIPRAPVAPDVSLILSETDGPELSFQAIYKKVLPSIVSIETKADDGYYQGTGVIMTDDGYVITNHHVIEGCSEASITLYTGQRYTAKLVGSDPASDLAVLKIETDGLTAAEFGSSDLLQVGDDVLAVGNPLGAELFGTMTNGIVSALNRDVTVEGYSMTLIQTTAALNPGNSGGALVNTAGQVIGITNMKMMSDYETIEGLGFAIPSVWAKEVVDALLDEGAITGRPSIGITCLTLTEEYEEAYGLDHGVYVATITAGGPAEKAGLQPGDIIISANGTDTPDLEALTIVRDAAGVGGTLELTIWRDGETLELSLTLVDQYELN